MSLITTHVLDTALGRPAAGVPVRLDHLTAATTAATTATTQTVAEATTDADGRVSSLGPDQAEPGTYRLTFDVAAYADATGQECFFPEAALTFMVSAPPEDGTNHHYHVPLLLSPFAYSTYRGS